MFTGNAEEAMTFYVSLFADGRVIDVQRYGAGEGGAEGSVKHATFAVAGVELMCIDSSMKHDFTFTPSISLFVRCEDAGEFDRLFGALSQGGSVLMPPASYGFSERFAWVADRFGVSWQLNQP